MNSFVQQIIYAIAAIDAEKKLVSDRMAQAEADGLRLVNSDPTGDVVKVWDERTGEALGTHEIRKPWPENWCHMDFVDEDICGLHETEQVDGIPYSLIEILIEWTRENESEARGFVGALLEVS